MSVILALDQGTTSSRALVFDEAGGIRGVARREFRQIYPQAGWVEHDPREIWATQLATAREALASAGVGTRERARRGELAFGTVDSWLMWNLTGGALHVTDPSNASRTLLFNLDTGAWDEELLRLLDVPREVLPEVRSSSEVYGETACGVLETPIRIGGIAGDQQAALFGQNCFARGLAMNTYGTGCFLLMHVGKEPVPSKSRDEVHRAWRANRTFIPQMSADEAAHRRSRWAEALSRARDWEEHSSGRAPGSAGER